MNESDPEINGLRTARSLPAQVEDVRQKVAGNAHAIVTHPYYCAVGVAREGHVDATAEVCVFGGIGEKVREALAQAHRIGHHVDSLRW